jgi:hypothetical protein
MVVVSVDVQIGFLSVYNNVTLMFTSWFTTSGFFKFNICKGVLFFFFYSRKIV